MLLLPARSDEPPQNSGRTVASAFITLPEAARVARSLPLSNTGITFSQSFGSSLLRKRFSRAAFSGLAFSQSKACASHSPCRCAPRSLTLRACAKTSVDTTKDSSGFNPSAIFVAATSCAPSAEPCDSAVPLALGAGHAITVCRRIKVGFLLSVFAANIAFSKASRSTLPSPLAETSMTFQPYAR